MKTKIKSYEEFVAKIDSLKEKSGVDLSITEDLSLAVMNLISLEEHFFFTGVKTGKENYFDTSLKVRDLRKELLAKLMPNHEGETWCISKHLLATTMRLMEVGNKLRSDDKNSEAVDMFKIALLQEGITKHRNKRRAQGHCDAKIDTVLNQLFKDQNQGNVGLGNRLVKPLFLQEIFVLGMPDKRQMPVQNQT